MKDQEHSSEKIFNLIEKQQIEKKWTYVIQGTFWNESGHHFLLQSYSKNWVDDDDYTVFWYVFSLTCLWGCSPRPDCIIMIIVFLTPKLKSQAQ